MADTPKLIVLSEKLRGKIFELTADRISVGRNDQRDICIKDSSISSHHCDLVKNGDKYTLIDHNSTNGTRVNNVPVMEQELKNSDIIQMGGVEILFDSSAGDTTVASRTQTGIEIGGTESSIETVPNFTNLNPFVSDDARPQKKSHKIVLVVLGILAVALLAGIATLLVWAAFS